MANFYIRQALGNNNNGGTSVAVLATGNDLVTNGSNNNVVSNSGQFTPAMVGHVIRMAGQPTPYRKITAYVSPTTVTVAGAINLTVLSGQIYTVGGPWSSLGNVGANAVISAGDTVYIGAGVYRVGGISWTISGNLGNPINVVGDVDGSRTGDAGEVVISAHTNGDRAAPASSTALSQNSGSSNLSFSNLHLMGGTSVNPTALGMNSGGSNIAFSDCILNGMAGTNSNALSVTALAGVAANHTYDRCVVWGGVTYTLPTVAGTDWDANVVFRNCLLINFAGIAVNIATQNAFSGKGGGIRFQHCNIYSGSTGLQVGATSGKIPCEIHGSIIHAPSGTGLQGNAGSLTEDYNIIYAFTARSNVNVGQGSVTNPAPQFELGQSRLLRGASVTMGPGFFGPSGSASVELGWGTSSGGTGAGSAGASGVAVDFYNRPRPAGGLSSAHAAGFMEYHDFANSDSTANDSPSAAVLRGPGDQYVQIPVDGTASATISIYMRFDSYTPFASAGVNYYPTVTLLANGELGVTAQTLTMANTASIWQQMTFSAIYPSKPGWVTLQIQSFDANGPPNAAGLVRFDTVGVV